MRNYPEGKRAGFTQSFPLSGGVNSVTQGVRPLSQDPSDLTTPIGGDGLSSDQLVQQDPRAPDYSNVTGTFEQARPPKHEPGLSSPLNPLRVYRAEILATPTGTDTFVSCKLLDGGGNVQATLLKPDPDAALSSYWPYIEEGGVIVVFQTDDDQWFAVPFLSEPQSLIYQARCTATPAGTAETFSAILLVSLGVITVYISKPTGEATLASLYPQISQNDVVTVYYDTIGEKWRLIPHLTTIVSLWDAKIAYYSEACP